MKQYYYPSKNPPYDEYVEFVQKELNKIRLTLFHDIPQVSPVDGKYGFQTAATVKAFQGHCSISVDGIWGPESRSALAQKIREQPSPSVRPVATNFSPIPSLISKAIGVIKSISDQAVVEIERVSRMGNALTSRIIQELPEKILRNNRSLREIQNAMQELWLRQDEVRNYLTERSVDNVFLKLTGKGISKKNIGQIRDAFFARQQLKNLNNLPAVKKANEAYQLLFNQYIERMQSGNFIDRMQQQINRMTKMGSKINVGRIFKPLSFLPLIIDLIAIPCFSYNDLPLDELLNKTFMDLCDVIEGYVIAAIISFFVFAAGLSGGVAIAVVAIVSVIIAVLCEIFNVHILYNGLSAAGGRVVE